MVETSREAVLRSWRAARPGASGYENVYDFRGKLRVVVQVYNGESLSVADAKKIWRYIQKYKGGKNYYNSLRNVKLRGGTLELATVYFNGDVRVGCKRIPYRESARVAKQLGFID